MAISLASGVLISTILTLIVIPLGCVQAADSLCEVAGMRCADSKKDDGSGTVAVGKPVWVKILNLAVAIVVIPLKILGSLVTTIIGLLRKHKSVQKKQVPMTSAVVTRDVSVAPKPASQQNAARSDTTVVPAVDKAAGKPVAKAKVAKSKKATADTGKVKKTAKAQKKQVPPPSAPLTEDVPVKPTSHEIASPKPEATAAPAVAKTANEPTAKPKAVAGTRKKATRKKAVAKQAAPTKHKVINKAAAKKKTTARPVSKKGAKKASGRRGIRLKSMHDSSDDGLS